MVTCSRGADVLAVRCAAAPGAAGVAAGGPFAPWDLASPAPVVDGSLPSGALARQLAQPRSLDLGGAERDGDRLVVVRDGIGDRVGSLPAHRVGDALSAGGALRRCRSRRTPVRELARFPALVVEHTATLDEVLAAALARPAAERYDDVLLHQRGRGPGGWRRLRAARLLEATTRWQTWRATRDDLTGLLVRSAFLDRVRETAAAGHGERLAVVFVDLDRLKAVNDRLGHAAGDALIRSVAAGLRRAARAGDAVARLGGDEFALACRVAPGAVAGAAEARAVAERLLRAVRDATADVVADVAVDVAGHLARGGEAPRLGASVGVAVSGPLHGAVDGEALLREADAAMYTAKVSGGGRVEVRTPARRRALLSPVPPPAPPAD